MTTIETIIINIIHNDEKASNAFQRAKYFKVRAIQTYGEAIESGNAEDLEFAHHFNGAYRRNMRRAMERITSLTGIGEDIVRQTMMYYASEVVTDAIIELGY